MISHGNLMDGPQPLPGNGLNTLRTSSPVLKPSVRRPSSDKARHMRPPAFMVRGSPTKASVRVPVLRPVDDFPRRNRFSRFALTPWRTGQRFDRQNGHLHCNGHPEDDCEPRSGCHVRLLMPALLMELAAIGLAACPRPRDERGWRKDSQKKNFYSA